MPTTLLTSASARDRQDAARRWLLARQDGQPMRLIGASFDALSQLVSRTVTQGAVLGWSRHTLGTLARQLAEPELVRRGWVAAEPLALTAAILDTLHERSGALGTLERLVGMPGLPRAVCDTLTELRLARIPERHIPEPLRTLLSAYSQQLIDRGLADRAAILELAKDAAPRERTLLLDVLPRWPAERELVRALLADDALATAPVGAAVGIRHLADALGVIPRRFPVTTTGALAAVQTRLFTEASAAHTPLDDSVRILSAPGAQRESVELVRAILRAAQDGVPFDQIAIVIHQPERYLQPVLEALDRARIPTFTTQGVPVPDPEGRAFLTLLDCATHQLDPRRLCDFVSMATLTGPSVSRRWETWLTRARVGGPSERFHARLEALAQDVPPERVEEVHALANVILPLVDQLHRLPKSATWPEWVACLTTLAEVALAEPESVVQTLASLSVLGDTGTASLRDVTRLLTPRLTERPTRLATQRGGRVWVGRTTDVLGLHFRVVLIPGLAERSFPVRIREDPLLLDTTRRSLPELITNPERAASERAALQQALGAATEQVVLSWPRVDGATGRPFVPSFYTLEVLRAATGQLPGFDELLRIAAQASAAPASWPAPHDPSHAIDEAEYDLALLADVVRHRAAPIPGLAHYLLDTNVHLARALRARARRWTVSSWTPADGLVRPRPDAVHALQAYRLGTRPVAVTTLERFAACPYQFFLHHIIGLRPLPDLAPVDRLEARTRGQLFHSVLADVVHRLQEDDGTVLTRQTRDRALAIAATSVHERAETLRQRLAPAVPRVWEDAVHAVHVDVRAAIHHLAEDPLWSVTHAELAVGVTPPAGSDAASTADPVQVEGALLTGVMDCVEQTAHGQLRVTDLKTGRLPVESPAQVAGGRMLQPILYARMLAKLRPDAEVVSGRLLAATRRHNFAQTEVMLNDRSKTLAHTVLTTIDSHIATGDLPAAPAAGACDGCRFLTVCGTAEPARVRRKRPLPQLAQLRKLP